MRPGKRRCAMQTSCPVDFHAIKGVSPVPPPSKVNHSTSWAGATVCEWQLVQLDPLVAKNRANSPVAGLGPPRQDWLIHLGAGTVGDPYWRSRSAWCSIGSAAALVAPAAGPFPSVCWGGRGIRHVQDHFVFRHYLFYTDRLKEG